MDQPQQPQTAAPRPPRATVPIPQDPVIVATTSPQPNGKAVITLDHVTKQFGEVKAVEDVSFEVYEGEIFGFIGPSGSGKTTTMRMINGIWAPSAGKVTLLGTDPSKPTRHLHEGFGYLPQLFVLYRNLSVYENLNFMASVHGLGWRERRKRIKDLLEFVEMWGSRNTLAGNVSGGMQRRLELAASLIHNPKLLFADEPTAGIDPVLRGKFWEEFRRLRDEEGRTLFVTTQYVGESEYCDRVGVIRRGKLIAIGTPLDLRRLAMNGDLLDISTFTPIPDSLFSQLVRLPFVINQNGKPLYKWVSRPTELRLNVQDAGESIPQVIPLLQEAQVQVKELQEYKPSFDEVFIALMGDDDKYN